MSSPAEDREDQRGGAHAMKTRVVLLILSVAVGPGWAEKPLIRFWREQPPGKRDRDAIRAFACDLGLTLKNLCLLY